MSFSSIAQLLLTLGPNLPAFIAFAQAVYSSWLRLQADLGNAPKLQARALSEDDHAQVARVAGAANLTAFDGHRISGLMKFVAANPQFLLWALGMFGVPVPPFPVNPPAPETTA